MRHKRHIKTVNHSSEHYPNTDFITLYFGFIAWTSIIVSSDFKTFQMKYFSLDV